MVLEKTIALAREKLETCPVEEKDFHSAYVDVLNYLKNDVERPGWFLTTEKMVDYATRFEKAIPVEKWRSHAHSAMREVLNHYFFRKLTFAPIFSRLVEQKLEENVNPSVNSLSAAIRKSGSKENLLKEANDFLGLVNAFSKEVKHVCTLGHYFVDGKKVVVPDKFGDLYNNRIAGVQGYAELFRIRVLRHEDVTG